MGLYCCPREPAGEGEHCRLSRTCVGPWHHQDSPAAAGSWRATSRSHRNDFPVSKSGHFPSCSFPKDALFFFTLQEQSAQNLMNNKSGSEGVFFLLYMTFPILKPAWPTAPLSLAVRSSQAAEFLAWKCIGMEKLMCLLGAMPSRWI